jgi:CheY-like chemotaxis protein
LKQTGEMIYLVDDDSRVCEALTEHLTSLGMEVVTFVSAAEYLDYSRSDAAACLILDLQLPDISGLDLQQQLAAETSPQIIFITGHGDIPSSVRAMKAGAIVDPSSGRVLRSFALPHGVHNFLFSADGTALFAYTTTNEVLQIDPDGGAVTASVKIPSPRGLAWTADYRRLIVGGKHELVILNRANLSIDSRLADLGGAHRPRIPLFPDVHCSLWGDLVSHADRAGRNPEADGAMEHSAIGGRIH